MRVVRWLPAVAVSLLLAACGGASKHAAPPATPQHVVAADIAACNAHDKAAARPLLTRRYARLALGPGDCNGGVQITHLRMSKTISDSEILRQQGYRYGADVVASFVIDRRHPGPWPHGPSGEVVYLVSKSASGPSVIDDEGHG